MRATSLTLECLYVIEVNLYLWPPPPPHTHTHTDTHTHRQNKCTPHQYSTPLRTIKNTPHYISCLFADVHFAHLFTGPSDFYTINIITHTGNTVLVANLQRDFNYDYILMDSLAKSSHAYARYGLQSSCLNMNGQVQAVDSHKIIGYLTTQTTINEEVFIYCHVISKMYST